MAVRGRGKLRKGADVAMGVLAVGNATDPPNRPISNVIARGILVSMYSINEGIINSPQSKVKTELLFRAIAIGPRLEATSAIR